MSPLGTLIGILLIVVAAALLVASFGYLPPAVVVPFILQVPAAIGVAALGVIILWWI